MNNNGVKTNDVLSDMNKNLELINDKISAFRVAIGDESAPDQAKQICLTCRSTYGLIVQSLAWADNAGAQEIYALIPTVTDLVDAGLVVLNEASFPGLSQDVLESFRDSVESKGKSLSDILNSKDLDQLFTLIA